MDIFKELMEASCLRKVSFCGVRMGANYHDYVNEEAPPLEFIGKLQLIAPRRGVLNKFRRFNNNDIICCVPAGEVAGVVLNAFRVEDVDNELDIIKKEIGSLLQIEVIHEGVVREFYPEVEFRKDDEGDYSWVFEWGSLLSFTILIQTMDGNVRISFLSSFHLMYK